MHAPSAEEEFSLRVQGMRKKSKATEHALYLKTEFMRRPPQRSSSKGKDERGSGFVLAFELAFAALPCDLGEYE